MGIRVWTAGLAGAGLVAGVIAGRVAHPPPAPSSVQWVLLGLALVVAGRLTVEIRHRGEVDAFDLFETALTPAIFFLPSPGVVLLVAAAKAVAQVWLRMPGIKLAFNVAQWTACAGCGSLTFAALAAGRPAADRLPALLASMTVVAAVNLIALAGLFALVADGPGVRSLFAPRELAWTAGLTVATVAAGVGITVAATDHPAGLLIVIALPLVLHPVGRGYALAHANLDRMRRIQAATQALSAVLDPGDGATQFLAEVASGCSAQAAELTLTRGDTVQAHRFVASPDARRQVETGLDTALTRTVLAGPLPTHLVAQPRRPRRWRSAGAGEAWSEPCEPAEALRAAGWRDCLAVPVMIDATRHGVLAVYDRCGFADVDQSDLMTLEALAREVSAVVQRARLVEEAIGARENAASIVRGSTDGIAAIAEDGSVVTWNPAFAMLTGRPAEQMLGAGRLSRLHACDGEGDPVHLEHWAAGGALPDELCVRTRDGQRRWLSCSYARTAPYDGTGPLLVVMARDVTELRRHRDLIEAQDRVLQLVASDEPPAKSLRAVAALLAGQIDGSAAVLLSDSGSPLRLSAAIEQDDGTSRLPADGDLLTGLNAVPAQEWATIAAAGQPLLLDLPAIGTATSPVPAGSGPSVGPEGERPGSGVRCWAMPVLDREQARPCCVLAVCPSGRSAPDAAELAVLHTAAGLAGVCLDRAAARARLAHQASHDPLTGLPNRVLFLDRCEHALQVARRSSGYAVVLFIDLDRFKVVNDSLGHDAGDRLLVAVADRLRDAVRPSDTIARFGGDEFTILCEELTVGEDARVLADRVLALFATPFHLQGRDVFETASVGIALGRAPERAEDLVQHADAAMYRAKAGGGNRYEFFDERLRRQAQARLASYNGLRRAVNGCEFEVHYQPTVALEDGRPVGVEALARWRHPTRGLLPPVAFIDLAEETGLIVQLGTQILRTALQEMPAEPLHGAAHPLRVSVNLSARQLSHPELISTVERALSDAGVPPARLSLEITESVLLTDSAATRTAISHLKQIGVDLSLDDFGTGHSSMDYLKFVPVDELKIERRFVAGLLTDHQDRAIVSAITHLGHDLGLRVVAEGVETAGQASWLRDLGCDVGQGYYFGPPMPVRDVLDRTRPNGGPPPQ